MALADDIRNLEAFIASGGQRFTYGDTTYTLTGAKKLLKQLQKQQTSEAAAAENEVIQTGATLRAAESSLRDAQENLQVTLRAFRKNNASEQDVRKAQVRAQTAEETLTRLRARTVPAGGVRRIGAPSTATAVTPTQPGGADAASLAAETARLAGMAGATGVTTPSSGGTGVGGGGGTDTTKPPKEGKTEETATANVLDELAARFPAYQDWTVEQATNYFGADLIKVLTDVANGVYGTGADKNNDAIKRAISQTNYWNTVDAAIKNWDALEAPDQQKRVTQQKANLAQVFGELQLDDATLTDLATVIQRTGLNELGAKQLVYGSAFARPRTETGPQPRQLALESAQADGLRRIAKAYGYRPPDLDAQIESILTGKQYAPTGTVLTEQSFRQKAEKLARGSFGHLQDQFDSGLTLEDIFGNYREVAARVLEVNPTEIDYMSNDKWFKAFGDAKTGQMSLSDWVRELKSNPDYGWRFTNQANQQVSGVVSTLERAFGLVR
jgi:hypothetical protein